MIGDLGLAKSIKEIRDSTKIVGTWMYMSPECIRNEKMTIKTDIW